jgi:hypothetical protein
MEVETGRGVGAACRPAGLGEDGGSSGRSGLARRLGWAWLISIGKNKKGFDIRI